MRPRVSGELYVRCERCGELTLAPGLIGRLLRLLLIIPFFAMSLGGLFWSLYISYTMVVEGALSGGFLLLSAVLGFGAAVGAWFSGRSLRRLLSKGHTLPLTQRRGAGLSQDQGAL